MGVNPIRDIRDCIGVGLVSTSSGDIPEQRLDGHPDNMLLERNGSHFSIDHHVIVMLTFFFFFFILVLKRNVLITSRLCVMSRLWKVKSLVSTR